MSETVTLTEEQQWALRELMSGKNVFLTGMAGAGKSTILQEFRKRVKRMVAFLAPTGMAARQVSGETCHRFFGLKALDVLSPEVLEPLNDKRKKILCRVETIVVDEVSMLRSDCLSVIDYRLRSVTGVDSLFGGKQMIFCGDFCQLLPVIKPLENFNLSDWLTRGFGGVLAFQTQVWHDAKIKVIFLHRVMRQKDDWLLARLAEIRYGIPNNRDDWLLEVNQVLCKNKAADESIIELCTRNDDVDRLNRLALKELPGEVITFRAEISGVYPEHEYPTDVVLKLKAGLRVMMLRNQSGVEESYVNGDLGIILKIDNTTWNDSRVIVKLDRGPIVTVGWVEWEHWEYSLEHDDNEDEEGEFLNLKKDGSFTQLPLRAAYAITIHKSQGMTFDRLKLHLGSGCFASGQLYTALSRCRTAAGIFLDAPIVANDIICAPEVADAYRKWDFSEKLWLEILIRHLDELPDEMIGVPTVIGLNWTEAPALPMLACLQKAYEEYCRRCPTDCDGELAECSMAESVWCRSVYYALDDLKRAWLAPAGLRMLADRVRLLKWRSQAA